MENRQNTDIESEEQDLPQDTPKEVFKRPLLIGKVGRLPRKIKLAPSSSSSAETDIKVNLKVDDQKDIGIKETNEPPEPPKVCLIVNSNTLPYKEPSWSGVPESSGKEYIFEVLKNGSIIETINLMSKSCWVFGRLDSCSICMQHPTISRYHAILQYRSEATESESPGFYIYDLGSTHGTFLNKNRLKSKIYVKVQVGHMLKLGCSTRTYILNGPDEDTEEESEYTVTELKQRRAEEMRKLEEAAEKLKMEEEEKRKKEEERGIDWGMGEDAEEETDLSENPYAQTTNEELYLDDPKKALRGFFEREGLNLEYDCNEHGMGQFLCKVELPVDDDKGRPIVAEVLHKGKKKEAVVQCALEACRILDRYGLLRQAIHESRKRKAKNWEENDFYDSDEDTFLDRTGAIEKKREQRMKAKAPEKAETYESLLEKERKILISISDCEKKLAEAQARLSSQSVSNVEEDSLDSYMKELKEAKPDKQALNKIKAELVKLRQEHANIIRLVNLARPASLPPLVPDSPEPSTSNLTINKALPIYGKRRKTKVQLPVRPVEHVLSNDDDDEEEVEDEEKVNDNENVTLNKEGKSEPENIEQIEQPHVETEESPSSSRVQEEIHDSSSSSSDDFEDFNSAVEFNTIKSFHNTVTFKKFERILKKGLPPFAEKSLSGKHQEKLERILNSLKKLAANEDRMHVDWKILAAKKRKVIKLISDLRNCESDEKLEHKISSELNRILTELNTMTEEKYKVIGKVKKMGNKIKTISEEIDKDFKMFSNSVKIRDDTPSTSKSGDLPEESVDSKDVENSTKSSIVENGGNSQSTELEDKKRKKNQRRIMQRQERAEQDRQRGYEEDSMREDYSMWVPPTDQSGDGRTNLNDRYGY